MREGSLRNLPCLDEDGPLVSIVIPTYNTPVDRLRRCLASINEQTYRNLDVVVVDDGSDSSYREALGNLVREDSRVRLVAGGHGGVSHARNAGIGESRGEWVCFSDADDELVPGFVEEALRIALREGADLVCGAVCYLYSGGVVDGGEQSEDYCVTDDPAALSAAARQMIGPVKYKHFTGPDFRGRGPVAKLYRRSTISNVRFDESIAIGEDTLFNYEIIKSCSSMAIVNRIWYRYWQYAGSAVHSPFIEPWVSSIDGILAACSDDEDESAFISRCAFMSFQGVGMFAQSTGHSRAVSMALLRHAQECGCYSRLLFDGFEPGRALKIMAGLCRRGRLSLAYQFWRANAMRGAVMKNMRLVDGGSLTC